MRLYKMRSPARHVICIVAAVTASVGASGDKDRDDALLAEHARRDLQSSLSCLMDGGGIKQCCPDKDPNDGICTMFWCMDTETLRIRDICKCSEIETSCQQNAWMAAYVEGYPQACAASDRCCAADGTTSNGEFNACTTEAKAQSDMPAPDFGKFFSGGRVPDPTALLPVGSDPAFPLGLCEGDCDSNNDCRVC